MTYKDFKGISLPALGFGTMRLPLLSDGKTIDMDLTAKMVDYAISHGVNYFDTAWPYHDGHSETVIGQCLSKYPRESWYLATKFPGHQHMKEFSPGATFEAQLRKCGVDYFDFYLMHNICENSLDDYLDPRWGFLDYFVEQRRLGRIKHLGFSTHATPETLESILDGPYGKEVEFCQIQLNYLDWNLQDAKRKVEILRRHGLPIWVMEPVRGGLLAHPGEDAEAALKAANPAYSPASWAFRWIRSIPEVTVILSGMSDMAQMADNVATFADDIRLTPDETSLLEDLASRLHPTVPCTGCRYCCPGCPAGLDIPTLLQAWNDLSLQFSFGPMMMLESLPDCRKPLACTGCGQCRSICPQGIDIPNCMEKLQALYDKFPKWSKICRQRNEILNNE